MRRVFVLEEAAEDGKPDADGEIEQEDHQHVRVQSREDTGTPASVSNRRQIAGKQPTARWGMELYKLARVTHRLSSEEILNGGSRWLRLSFVSGPA